MKKETELITKSENIVAILNQTEYDAAAQLKQELKSFRKQIAETFKPIIDKAHKAHKEAISQMKKVEEPFIAQERRLDPILATWLTEQSKIREEKLAEMRREKALIEERALAAADIAQEHGDEEAARDIIESVNTLAPAALDKPDSGGIHVRKNWKYRIVDASKVPEQYKKIDESKIGKVVRALGEHASILGVETYCETTTVARGVL